MESVVADVKTKFNTDQVTNRDGIKQDWLDYHYKGFPLVASLTKLTSLQADIKTTESEVLSNMLQGTQASQLSMTNYTTLMETSKSAYFNGQKFDGQIVLGRKDGSTKPSKVELTLDGRKLSESQYSIEDGKVKLNIGTGSVGEHKIEGKLIFAQDGEEVEVPVKTSFATIGRPNSATISADKMNVVYRGVKNPMTISFAGIPNNKVTASAQGLSRKSGSSYVMDATKISGREVTINVTGTLPDGGGKVTDNAKFRIKDLPKPTGTIRGEDGSVKMQRNSLAISTVGAKFEDFEIEGRKVNIEISENRGGGGGRGRGRGGDRRGGGNRGGFKGNRRSGERGGRDNYKGNRDDRRDRGDRGGNSSGGRDRRRRSDR